MNVKDKPWFYVTKFIRQITHKMKIGNWELHHIFDNRMFSGDAGTVKILGFPLLIQIKMNNLIQNFEQNVLKEVPPPENMIFSVFLISILTYSSCNFLYNEYWMSSQFEFLPKLWKIKNGWSKAKVAFPL